MPSKQPFVARADYFRDLCEAAIKNPDMTITRKISLPRSSTISGETTRVKEFASSSSISGSGQQPRALAGYASRSSHPTSAISYDKLCRGNVSELDGTITRKISLPRDSFRKGDTTTLHELSGRGNGSQQTSKPKSLASAPSGPKHPTSKLSFEELCDAAVENPDLNITRKIPLPRVMPQMSAPVESETKTQSALKKTARQTVKATQKTTTQKGPDSITGKISFDELCKAAVENPDLTITRKVPLPRALPGMTSAAGPESKQSKPTPVKRPAPAKPTTQPTASGPSSITSKTSFEDLCEAAIDNPDLTITRKVPLPRAMPGMTGQQSTTHSKPTKVSRPVPTGQTAADAKPEAKTTKPPKATGPSSITSKTSFEDLCEAAIDNPDLTITRKVPLPRAMPGMTSAQGGDKKPDQGVTAKPTPKPVTKPTPITSKTSFDDLCKAAIDNPDLTITRKVPLPPVKPAGPQKSETEQIAELAAEDSKSGLTSKSGLVLAKGPTDKTGTLSFDELCQAAVKDPSLTVTRAVTVKAPTTGPTGGPPKKAKPAGVATRPQAPAAAVNPFAPTEESDTSTLKRPASLQPRSISSSSTPAPDLPTQSPNTPPPEEEDKKEVNKAAWACEPVPSARTAVVLPFDNLIKDGKDDEQPKNEEDESVGDAVGFNFTKAIILLILFLLLLGAAALVIYVTP